MYDRYTPLYDHRSLINRTIITGAERNIKQGPAQVQAQVPPQGVLYNDASRGRSNVIKPYNGAPQYNAQMQHQNALSNAPVQQNVRNLAKYPGGQIPGAANYSQPITVDTSHWYGSGQYPGDSPGHYGNYGGASAPMSANTRRIGRATLNTGENVRECCKRSQSAAPYGGEF